MKRSTVLLIAGATMTIAACGNNFEWFPTVQDTTPPAVSASISGNSIFDNRTAHISSLPANVTFATNEAATIYYTTNGETPTTSSSSVDIASASSTTGPSISVTNTILKFFGVDHSANKNSSAVHTGTIISP
jgi:hypothetical protein